MDASEDTASTTNQGHEELKQRIFQLEAELQLKEASLQNQARRIQVSTELIAKMRTELRKQSMLSKQEAIATRPFQAPASSFGLSSARDATTQTVVTSEEMDASHACSVERVGLHAFSGAYT